MILFDEKLVSLRRTTTVYVDPEKCTVCGECTNYCPEVFQYKDGKIVYNENIGSDRWECFEQAMLNCPEQAIIEAG